MEMNQILELMKVVSENNLEFTYEESALKLSIRKLPEKSEPVPVIVSGVSPQVVSASVPIVSGDVAQTSAPVPSQESASDQEGELTGQVVKSPLVGTFYESASPDADPFVQVGDTVKQGQVLGIVEAMKLMNEIESDYSGVVKKILVKDGDLIEFDQPLFVIE